MMYHVWVTSQGGRIRIASADTLEAAMHYAHQYRNEGRVTVNDGNRIVSVMSAKTPANPGAD